MRRIDTLDRGLAAFAQVVAQVRHGDLDRATPCDDWTVAEVIAHALGVIHKFGSFAEGDDGLIRTPTDDLVGRDHGEAARREVARARAAWASVDPTRTCRLPFGSFPVTDAAGINLFDVLAHAWDVADACAIALDVDDDVWDDAHTAARTFIGEQRDENHYGAAVVVPADAPPQDRFLAHLGRTP